MCQECKVQEVSLFYDKEILQWVMEVNGLAVAFGGTPEEAIRNHHSGVLEYVD